MEAESTSVAPSGLQATDASTIAERYHTVRSFTETLCDPLETEDYVVQTKENVSPTKWHLAHTSWFFETFLLKPHLDGYEPLDEQYAYLFNSYYIQAGERHCRDRRGYISRPTVAEVYAFRTYVDEHMDRLLADAERRRELAPLVEIGVHHEQQHQELMVTDIKHVFSVNPLRPAYRDLAPSSRIELPELAWTAFDEGIYEVGYEGDGFHFDNEGPRHKTYLQPFALANRLVTNGEFIAFIEDDGYRRPELWLSEGWATVQERDWTEPFYWEKHDGQWYLYTLGGMREVNPSEPACHITYFEADAFARWAGARLPEEKEWEVAARDRPMQGNFVDEGRYHPAPLHEGADPDQLYQMYGDVWEWTRSAYSPYPGYEPLPGAIGEYNGKFMCGQFVLRGGSCATSRSHIRPTYRNFFYPDEAWQFMGFRLARDV
ncbi:MAG: ergothioneine biosynthesis protein EgtB [Bacteroidetes bacterium]|jgi:ergothioneine biosynthesis protein EgtB|nr:ergothioneine biosynthesis protein EgtB [Bacteroidota bacterium]